MCVQLQIQPHPLNPVGRHEIEIQPGQTLEQVLAGLLPQYESGTAQPMLARVNGEAIDPAYWGDRTLRAGEVVSLRPRPFGDPFTLAIALVGATAAAYTFSQLTRMDIPGQQSHRDLPEQSATYDLQTQGNMARLNQPIPVGYGYQRVWPDLAGESYRRYENGEQYLYHLFSIGQGKYQLSGPQVGATPLANFEDVEEQLYAPGETVTLFAPEVLTSDAVANIDLHAPNDPDYQGVSGPFVATPLDTQARRLEIDVLINGLYRQNEQSGALETASVTVKAEYQAIDDNNNPLGEWQSLVTQTLSDRTVDIVRKTLGADVPAGRYQVRVSRTNATDTESGGRLRDDAVWSELRAVLDTDAVFDHTVWAVKIRVTGQLSAQAERKFSCMRQRLLDVWDGSQWIEDQVTRNPAWAFCDLVKGPWGGGYDDSYLDLPTIKRLADIWHARNDYFDYNLDTKGSLDSVLKMICRVGRAVKVEYSGVYSIVRDEPKQLPDYQFGMPEIVAGSFDLEWNTLDQWEDDSVEVEYIDGDTGLPDTVLCVLPGKLAKSPRTIKMEGITTRQHAYREGMFEAARMEFRNRVVRYKTELAGGIPSYGSSVAVNYYSSNWGVSGSVLAVINDDDNNRQTLILSEPVVFESGVDHVISLADARNQPQGPYSVIPGDRANEVVISTDHNATIYTGFQKKRTSFQFGAGDKRSKRFLMREVVHAGGLQFSHMGELDDPRVHEFDGLIDSGQIPVPPPANTSAAQLAQVRGLRVEYTGTAANPILNLSWNQVLNADSFVIQISRDGGSTWKTFEQMADLFLQKVIAPGDAKLRIAAMAGVVGPWYQIDITPGASVHKPNAPTGLVLSEPWVGNALRVNWSSGNDAKAWIVNVCLPNGTPKRSVKVEANTFEYTYLDARTDGVGRDLILKVWGVGENDETSDQPAELVCHNDQVGPLSNLQVDSAFNVAMIQADYPSDPDFSGFRIWVGSTPNFTADASTLQVELTTERLMSVPLPADFSARYVRIAGVDVWGNTDLSISPSYSVQRRKIDKTQIDDNSIETPHLVANAVTAEKCLIEYLSALTADLGIVTGGTFKTSSANGTRVEMSSQGDLVFWIGTGNKTEANALFSINKTTGKLIYRGDLDIQSNSSGDRMVLDNDSLNVIGSNGVKLVELGKLS